MSKWVGKIVSVLGLPLVIWLALCGRREERLIHRQTSIGKDGVVLKPIDKVYKRVKEDDASFKKTKSKANAKIVDSAKEKRQANQGEPNKKKTPRKEDKDKPLFILHVGPPKTGTTTAQWGAARNEELLLQDGIHYLGHYGKRQETKRHQLVWACTQGREDECAEKWNDLDKAVKKLYQQSSKNKTIAFLSEELFSHFKNEEDERNHLWKYLVPILDKWHVRVVLTYRHFYDWAPSYYAQLNEPKDKKKHRMWPSPEGGKRIPTFPEYFDEIMKLHYHRLLALRDKWAQYFPDVWVFNMHESEDYRTSFFCKMLPEAQHLCRAFQEMHATVTRNPSSSKVLHHDMIAVEAQQQGWMHPNMTRPDARQAVETHASKLGLTSQSHFPQVCLSQSQIRTLRRWSWKLESKLLPHASSKRRIKADIAEALKNTTKFCSVDAKKVLKDKKWKDFFKSLEPNE